MKITPYTALDNLNFTDSYEDVKAKLEFDYEESISEDMDTVYPVLYVEETDMMIQFNEDASSVRYFELLSPKADVFCEDTELAGNYIEVLKRIRELDADIETEDDGFTSSQLGITVSRQLEDGLYSNKVEGIVVFSKAFLDEQEADPDDFLKFHLGYNPFDGEDK